ncbi:hypothetical protein WT72_00935 [Burkholderia pseudomultivorans]|nr:hypothetical protein WT72_00935 [Burkholderia pseudomultivorans]
MAALFRLAAAQTRIRSPPPLSSNGWRSAYRSSSITASWSNPLIAFAARYRHAAATQRGGVCPWRVVAIGLSGGVPCADGFTADAGRKDECGGIDNAWKEVTGQHGGDDVAMECASILVR